MSNSAIESQPPANSNTDSIPVTSSEVSKSKPSIKSVTKITSLGDIKQGGKSFKGSLNGQGIHILAHSSETQLQKVSLEKLLQNHQTSLPNLNSQSQKQQQQHLSSSPKGSTSKIVSNSTELKKKKSQSSLEPIAVENKRSSQTSLGKAKSQSGSQTVLQEIPTDKRGSSRPSSSSSQKKQQLSTSLSQEKPLGFEVTATKKEIWTKGSKGSLNSTSGEQPTQSEEGGATVNADVGDTHLGNPEVSDARPESSRSRKNSRKSTSSLHHSRPESGRSNRSKTPSLPSVKNEVIPSSVPEVQAGNLQVVGHASQLQEATVTNSNEIQMGKEYETPLSLEQTSLEEKNVLQPTLDKPNEEQTKTQQEKMPSEIEKEALQINQKIPSRPESRHSDRSSHSDQTNHSTSKAPEEKKSNSKNVSTIDVRSQSNLNKKSSSETKLQPKNVEDEKNAMKSQEKIQSTSHQSLKGSRTSIKGQSSGNISANKKSSSTKELPKVLSNPKLSGVKSSFRKTKSSTFMRGSSLKNLIYSNNSAMELSNTSKVQTKSDHNEDKEILGEHLSKPTSRPTSGAKAAAGSQSIKALSQEVRNSHKSLSELSKSQNNKIDSKIATEEDISKVQQAGTSSPSRNRSRPGSESKVNISSHSPDAIPERNVATEVPNNTAPVDSGMPPEQSPPEMESLPLSEGILENEAQREDIIVQPQDKVGESSISQEEETHQKNNADLENILEKTKSRPSLQELSQKTTSQEEITPAPDEKETSSTGVLPELGENVSAGMEGSNLESPSGQQRDKEAILPDKNQGQQNGDGENSELLKGLQVEKLENVSPGLSEKGKAEEEKTTVSQNETIQVNELMLTSENIPTAEGTTVAKTPSGNLAAIPPENDIPIASVLDIKSPSTLETRPEMSDTENTIPETYTKSYEPSQSQDGEKEKESNELAQVIKTEYQKGQFAGGASESEDENTSVPTNEISDRTNFESVEAKKNEDVVEKPGVRLRKAIPEGYPEDFSSEASNGKSSRDKLVSSHDVDSTTVPATNQPQADTVNTREEKLISKSLSQNSLLPNIKSGSTSQLRKNQSSTELKKSDSRKLPPGETKGSKSSIIQNPQSQTILAKSTSSSLPSQNIEFHESVESMANSQDYRTQLIEKKKSQSNTSLSKLSKSHSKGKLTENTPSQSEVETKVEVQQPQEVQKSLETAILPEQNIEFHQSVESMAHSQDLRTQLVDKKKSQSNTSLSKLSKSHSKGKLTEKTPSQTEVEIKAEMQQPQEVPKNLETAILPEHPPKPEIEMQPNQQEQSGQKMSEDKPSVEETKHPHPPQSQDYFQPSGSQQKINYTTNFEEMQQEPQESVIATSNVEPISSEQPVVINAIPAVEASEKIRSDSPKATASISVDQGKDLSTKGSQNNSSCEEKKSKGEYHVSFPDIKTPQKQAGKGKTRVEPLPSQLEHVGNFSNYPLYKLPVTPEIAKLYEDVAKELNCDIVKMESELKQRKEKTKAFIHRKYRERISKLDDHERQLAYNALKNERIEYDRYKRAYQTVIGKLRHDLNRVKFERNSPVDPLNEISIFPYLSRSTFAITKRKRIPLGTTPKASDFFEMNPPFPSSIHPDTGFRWWWGSKGNILEPEQQKKYRIPLVDTRLYRTALDKEGLAYLTDYMEDSPLRFQNQYFKPRMNYSIMNEEEVRLQEDGEKTEHDREEERKESERRQKNFEIDSQPHEPLWNMFQRVSLSLEGVVRNGKIKYVGHLEGKPKYSIWCGVQLDEPVGTHDGIVYGTRYFRCPDKKGIMVHERRLFLPASNSQQKD